MPIAEQPSRLRDTHWIDQLLSAVMSGLALFCCGIAVSSPEASTRLIVYLAATAATGFAISYLLRNSRLVRLDGFVLAGLGAVALFGQPILNQLLPDDTFPPELASAGLLAWLLVLGSAAAWRDMTRLFLAAPALALFGLVGVYDTYPNASFVFFAFLLCLALLFGRAHARTMLQQAHRSGFARALEGVPLTEAGAEQDAMLRAMRRGPWRWMAGPEWAVASAGAVVLVSLVGAPVIHDTVAARGPLVHLRLPDAMAAQQRSNGQTLTTDSLVRVGRGPRIELRQTVGVASLDRARYLKTADYDTYEDGAWSLRDMETDSELSFEERLAELRRLKAPHDVPFAVTMTGESVERTIPAPEGVVQITSPSRSHIDADGVVSVFGAHVEGIARESTIAPGDPRYPDVLTADPGRPVGPATVAALAERAAAGAHNDWERAEAIMHEIARRADYNLKAAATEPGQDPVESFLFQTHEGYCDLFASAMVVMARDVHLRARYCVGYLTDDDERDASGRYLLQASNAHAWAEIYFKGVGWQVFDPTAEARNVTPGARSTMALTLDVLAGGAVFGLLAAALHFGPRVGAGRRASASARRRGKLSDAYLSFARELGRRAKLRRPLSATPDRWLADTAPALGAAAEAARTLNARFVEALYSAAPIDEAGIAELRRATREFKRVPR